MYKYVTKNNTYRYLDIINKQLACYKSVHSTIGMPPSKVNPSTIYSVWQKMNSLRGKIPQVSAKFEVQDLVRIIKGKGKIWQGCE